jgi:hypothetical protein
MMFVQDAPLAVNLATTHGQPKFEKFTFAARLDIGGPSCCRGEGYILPQVTSTS